MGSEWMTDAQIESIGLLVVKHWGKVFDTWTWSDDIVRINVHSSFANMQADVPYDRYEIRGDGLVFLMRGASATLVNIHGA